MGQQCINRAKCLTSLVPTTFYTYITLAKDDSVTFDFSITNACMCSAKILYVSNVSIYFKAAKAEKICLICAFESRLGPSYVSLLQIYI